DFAWRIVVLNNGSTDDTLERACRIAESCREVGVLHLPEKGRGRALRHAFQQSDADVRMYMDIDLSTSLDAVLPLVRAITEEGYDLAVGTRLHRDAAVARSLEREAVSQMYNLLVRFVFDTRFSDAQCGFKAVSAKTARVLVPQVKDDEWFFDTELLLLAERNGYRIKDVPVVWVEDPDSRVNVGRTALQDVRGMARLKFGGIPRIIAAECGREGRTRAFGS
ncbi:MAG TPA: glycosyltransferase, partial [Dehalococcoidia bacterium]|nr:glycosyltransferase [Dehalococcoidia bacterium]